MFVRLSAAVLVSATYAAGACENLSSLKLDNATITSAQVVAAGAFRLPGGRQGPEPIPDAPGILPRAGDPHSQLRFRHQGGSPAACLGLE